MSSSGLCPSPRALVPSPERWENFPLALRMGNVSTLFSGSGGNGGPEGLCSGEAEAGLPGTSLMGWGDVKKPGSLPSPHRAGHCLSLSHGLTRWWLEGKPGDLDQPQVEVSTWLCFFIYDFQPENHMLENRARARATSASGFCHALLNPGRPFDCSPGKWPE